MERERSPHTPAQAAFPATRHPQSSSGGCAGERERERAGGRSEKKKEEEKKREGGGALAVESGRESTANVQPKQSNSRQRNALHRWRNRDVCFVFSFNHKYPTFICHLQLKVSRWDSSLSVPESRARIFRGGSNLKVDCHTSTLSPDAPSAAQHQVTSVAAKRCICTAHKEPSVPPEQPGGLGPRLSSFGRKLLFQPPQKRSTHKEKG